MSNIKMFNGMAYINNLLAGIMAEYPGLNRGDIMIAGAEIRHKCDNSHTSKKNIYINLCSTKLRIKITGFKFNQN